jgi:putative heme iron utilization protein
MKKTNINLSENHIEKIASNSSVDKRTVLHVLEESVKVLGTAQSKKALTETGNTIEIGLKKDIEKIASHANVDKQAVIRILNESIKILGKTQFEKVINESGTTKNPGPRTTNSMKKKR